MEHKLGHYELVSELGRGGMGVVFKAFDTRLERQVAIKVLGRQISEDPTLIARFKREAKSAASLNHPNIVQIYFIGEEDGQHYFAMELVQGESLSQILKREKKLSLERAAHILWQAASGLAEAHGRDIIHRDIKPGNLMLTETGLVKIADFGIAHVPDINEKLTATGQFMGTPGYVPPEVCIGQPVDIRSDIFSLGIVYYEMLAGVLPFQSDSPYELIHKIVKSEIPDIRGLNEDVDPETRRILNKMLHKEKEARYQNCGELIADLEAGPLAGRTLGSLRPNPALTRKTKQNQDAIETERITPPAIKTETIRDLSPVKPPTLPVQQAPPPPPRGKPPIPPPVRQTDNEVEPPPRLTAHPPARKRRVWPLIAALILLPALIAGGYYLYTQNRDKDTAIQNTLLPDKGDKDPDQDHSPEGTDSEKSTTGNQTEGSLKNDLMTTDNRETVAADESANTEETSGNVPAEPENEVVQVGSEPIVNGTTGEATQITTSVTPKKDAQAVGSNALQTSGGHPSQNIAETGSSKNGLSGTGGSDGSDQPLAVNRRAAAPGGPPMVAVWVTGDPVFIMHMEEALERYLTREELSLMTEKGALTLDPFRDEPAPAIDRLGMVLQGLGAEYMVFAELEITGERELHYGNRSGFATEGQIRVRCLRLNDLQPIGKTWRREVTYTSLNAQIKAEEAVRRITGEIGTLLRGKTP